MRRSGCAYAVGIIGFFVLAAVISQGDPEEFVKAVGFLLVTIVLIAIIDNRRPW